MAIAWACNAPEPGRRFPPPTWTAQLGPVRLVVQQHGEARAALEAL